MSSDDSRDTPHVSLLGTTALLFEAPGTFDLPHQRRIWSLARTTQTWPEIREAVPGMTNLMLTFKAPPRDLAALEARLLEAWAVSPELEVEGRVLDLPVVYGGEGGPHLADVVAHTGLPPEEVVLIHTAAPYPVFALGSHPGYCYLGNLDPRLFVPRRKVPLMSVPAGSVSIAGMQTGVSASAGPSGWNTIGQAVVSFFDPSKEPPALQAPGDWIRVHAGRNHP